MNETGKPVPDTRLPPVCCGASREEWSATIARRQASGEQATNISGCFSEKFPAP
ncbi:MAG: hypothetical protein PSX71_14885 [bacterium]|nr:hypothetical protein [bacterium]